MDLDGRTATYLDDRCTSLGAILHRRFRAFCNRGCKRGVLVRKCSISFSTLAIASLQVLRTRSCFSRHSFLGRAHVVMKVSPGVRFSVAFCKCARLKNPKGSDA